MAQEQARKNLHYPVNQHGELVFPGRGRLRVKVLDIALQGATIASDTQLPLGERGELHLLFLVPVTRRFSATFTIVNLTLCGGGFHVSLKFEPLSPEMQETLLGFTRTRGAPAMVRPD